MPGEFRDPNQARCPRCNHRWEPHVGEFCDPAEELLATQCPLCGLPFSVEIRATYEFVSPPLKVRESEDEDG